MKPFAVGIRRMLASESDRIHLQFLAVFFLMALVSFFMTIVNRITGFHALMFSTLLFGFVNLFCLLLELGGAKCKFLSRGLFACSFLLLFAFFVIVGEPEGFSAIWAALLPACGLLLYRIRYGTLFSMLELMILLFFFWTPFGRSLLQYSYTSSFLLRFPLLYLAFFFVGFCFEFIRYATQQELQVARDQYEHLYTHDALTGLGNRYGFDQEMEKVLAERKEYLFAIADVDFFKKVNDQHGHLAGDKVLQQIAAQLKKTVGPQGIVCRWGGEEFSICSSDLQASQRILTDMRALGIPLDGELYRPHVSIGSLRVHPGVHTLEELVQAADRNLYEAKRCGRDQEKRSELL